MEQTLCILNEMKHAGVVSEYAIGGAIAALFYVEPFETHDLDIFVVLPASQQTILTLTAIYEYLQSRGYDKHEGECVSIAGVPVQFLVAGTPLVENAITHAATRAYGATTTRVMTPEHLVAIMLETGRPKDMARIDMFLSGSVVQLDALTALLQHYNLVERWDRYQKLAGTHHD